MGISENKGRTLARRYRKGCAQWRRMLFFGAALIFNVLAVLWVADLFWTAGWHRAHVPLLLVFAILNGMLVVGAFHAFFGFWDIVRGGKQAVKITELGEEARPLEHRYAVVMPVYNEDSGKFCARIEAIYRSIEQTGELDKFDFLLLSDTRDVDLWVIEEMAWASLCRRLDAFGKIFYRRRKVNENRKAGNIGDFVRTWGGRYEGMMVLDADSLMDGGDVVKMAKTMEAHPNLGILQTAPQLIRGASVFTRLQQFAMSLYSPLFVRGLNYWQLGGGSYWGHNALIRLKPFSDFCELPDLPGSEPFGGRILSHDFVEAALMVAEGWEVWLAWDIKGSYEEAPPTLADHLIRDRRWCQGNLQHLWLIFARKLPFSVRMHLFMGIMAYLGGPLWFLFLIMGTWLAWDFEMSNLSVLPFDGFVQRYLGIGSDWQGGLLICMVAVLLFLPKVLAVLRAAFSSEIRRSFGGITTLLTGALLETLISMILAPCLMVAHTMMVLSILSGRAVGWGSQSRETDGTSWKDAVRFHWLPTVLGIGWTILALKIGLVFTLWMSPILIGLIVCMPVSVWTSRARYGKALREVGIFTVGEEIEPPGVLKLAWAAELEVDTVLDAKGPGRDGFLAAVVDPYVNGVHLSLLEKSALSAKSESLARRCLRDGPEWLTPSERADLLYLEPAMLLMHRTVWLGNMENLSPVWKKAVESYRRS